jgi:hypothetical protein
MLQKPTRKVITVHRVFGRYEVEGEITCIPCPLPGKEAALVESLIDQQVEELVRDRMVEDLLSSYPKPQRC